MIKELPWTVSLMEGQGRVGIRRWLLGPHEDLDAFLQIVCESHWPGHPDCVPVRVDAGASSDKVVIIRDDSTPRTMKTLGPLPRVNETLVTGQYALHRMSNCWPDFLSNKPKHPAGTTLSLSIRGSGQFLLVNPAGMRALGFSPQMALDQSFNSRILIPITEYHLTCDRMTKEQVDAAFTQMDLDKRCNTVNSDEYLGRLPGTLLFETWNMEETTIPHPDRNKQLRYRITAVLRHRTVWDDNGNVVHPLYDPAANCGWNQDFISQDKQKTGWYSIKFMQGTAEYYRYRFVSFENIFMAPETQSCGGAGSDGSSIGQVCLPLSTSSSAAPSAGSSAGGSSAGDSTASSSTVPSSGGSQGGSVSTPSAASSVSAGCTE